MKKRITLFFLLIILAINSYSQWTNIGRFYSAAYMVNDSEGYRSHYPSGSGHFYNIMKTSNDFINDTSVFHNFANNYGCGGKVICTTLDSCLVFEWCGQSASVLKTIDGYKSMDTIYQSWKNINLNSHFTVGQSIYLSSNGRRFGKDLYRIIQFDSIIEINLPDPFYLIGNTYAPGNTFHFFSENNGLVIVRDTNQMNGILKTNDFGNSWNLIYSDTNNTFSAFHFKNDTLGILATGQGKLFRTIDGGNTWNYQNQPTFGQINDIEFLDSNVVLMACDSGRIYKSVDNGFTWSLDFQHLNYLMGKIQHVGNNIAYISSNYGYVYKNRALTTSSKNNALETKAISIYPNPTSDFIILGSSPSSRLFFRLIDLQGKLILEGSNKTINVQNINPGIYILKIQNDGQTYTERIIIN